MRCTVLSSQRVENVRPILSSWRTTARDPVDCVDLARDEPKLSVSIVSEIPHRDSVTRQRRISITDQMIAFIGSF